MVDVKWAIKWAPASVLRRVKSNTQKYYLREYLLITVTLPWNLEFEVQTNHQFGGGRAVAEAEKQPAFARRRVVVVVVRAQLANSSSFRFHVDLDLDTRRR